MPEKSPTTNQLHEFENVAAALCKRFLYKNSHIDGIGKRIEQWVIETLDVIRRTPKKFSTKSIIDRIKSDTSRYEEGKNLLHCMHENIP